MTNNNPNFMTGISLTEKERKVVREFADKNGLNFSAALRVIINSFNDRQLEYVRIPVIGMVNDSGKVTLDKLPEVPK